MRTERLTLARPTATDAAGVFAILGDPRTVEHNPSDRLEDRGAAAELVTRWVHHWEEHGFGYWCVREPGSDRIIGYAGVKRMLMHGLPVLNLVYRFVPEVWGRGFATEAAAAVLSRAMHEMPAETIVARVRPDNRSSQNVALKAGLRRDATMDCQGEDGLDLAFTSREIHDAVRREDMRAGWEAAVVAPTRSSDHGGSVPPARSGPTDRRRREPLGRSRVSDAAFGWACSSAVSQQPSLPRLQALEGADAAPPGADASHPGERRVRSARAEGLVVPDVITAALSQGVFVGRPDARPVASGLDTT